jgi:hypothetical protein
MAAGNVQYVPVPVYDYRLEQRPRRPRRSRGLLIAGSILFAVSYVPPALIGLAVASQPREQCDCRDALRLLVPIVGPVMMWKPDRDFNFFFNALMVIDTVMQVAGATMLVIGIIRYSASAQDDPQANKHTGPQLSFSAMPTPGGAYGALRLQL